MKKLALALIAVFSMSVVAFANEEAKKEEAHHDAAPAAEAAHTDAKAEKTDAKATKKGKKAKAEKHEGKKEAHHE